MILESSKVAPDNRADHDSPTIRVFQLKRQNRKHEHLAVDADVVRQRSPPVHLLKEEVKGKKRRQISATIPTSSSTSSTSTAPTGTPQSSPSLTTPGITTITGITTIPGTITLPGSTITVVLVPSVTVITSGAQTLTIPAGTVTEVIVPAASVTVIVSGTQTFTVPSGVSFPEQSVPPAPLPSGGATLLPGPGSTVTITQPNGPGSFHHTLSSTVPPTIPTIPASVNPPPPSGARRSASTIAGAVVGGTVALVLIILLAFCYRRKRQSRATGPVLLADPFQEQAWVPPHEAQRVGADITTPSPFRGDALSGTSQSQLSSSVPPPVPVKGEKKVDTHGRDASISTSHSPFASAEDSMVTMADLNLLRARILEVENMALRQRIADVENMAQAGPSNHPDALASSTSLHPPRASESPPEYASPLDEAPSDSRA